MLLAGCIQLRTLTNLRFVEDLLNDDVLNDVLPEKLIDDVTEPAKTNEDRKPIVEEEKVVRGLVFGKGNQGY